MSLTKHGEGNIIPENEKQKTAAKQGTQMSEEARQALAKENAEADGRDSTE